MLWNSKRSAGVFEESLTPDYLSSQIAVPSKQKNNANEFSLCQSNVSNSVRNKIKSPKPQLPLRVKNVNPMVDPKRASHLTHSKKPWWRTQLKLSQSSKTDLRYRTIRSSNKREIIQATRKVRVPIVSKQVDQFEQYKYQTRSTKPAGTSSRLKPPDAQRPIGPRSRTTLYPRPAQ